MYRERALRAYHDIKVETDRIIMPTTLRQIGKVYGQNDRSRNVAVPPLLFLAHIAHRYLGHSYSVDGNNIQREEQPDSQLLRVR